MEQNKFEIRSVVFAVTMDNIHCVAAVAFF